MPVWSHRNGVASFDELALDTLGAWFDQLGLDGDARPLRLRLTTEPRHHRSGDDGAEDRHHRVVSTTLNASVCSDAMIGLTLATNGTSVAAAIYNVTSRTIDPGLTAAVTNVVVPANGVAAGYLSGDKFTKTGHCLWL